MQLSSVFFSVIEKTLSICTYYFFSFHLCFFNALVCVAFFIVYLFNKQKKTNNNKQNEQKSSMSLSFQIFENIMVGLTNESPTFCFDRDELSMVELILQNYFYKIYNIYLFYRLILMLMHSLLNINVKLGQKNYVMIQNYFYVY